MEFLTAIFLLGLTAKFAHAESAEHLEIDALPDDWKSQPATKPAL